jgi:hypothetical protein
MLNENARADNETKYTPQVECLPVSSSATRLIPVALVSPHLRTLPFETRARRGTLAVYKTDGDDKCKLCEGYVGIQVRRLSWQLILFAAGLGTTRGFYTA